ncbi:MAG TPA: hydrolase 1, exosortase A system-associated [Alphaproteobacteria bacterium]|nr:hydrolase 1, exosortase A system-associated [Alphaproteobacteria bacterium]
MNASETPFVFSCAGEPLIGIVHEPAQPARTGVLIIVGGPQYRIGSHRQFLLIARALAAAGVPAMRFDYRGMGDSGGDYAGFEHIDADIAAAIDAFMARHPSLREVVLWGLCDAASAALFYAHKDERVGGLVLVNPWVRTVAGEAKAYLKHYYWSRLVDGAFWRKVISGQFSVTSSLCSLLDLTKKARTREAHSDDRALPLPQRMAEGLRRFSGPVLLIISGNDLTAREFEDAAAASPLWRELLGAPRVISHRLDAADHTFSRREWRARVSAWTVAMVNQLPNGIAKA